MVELVDLLVSLRHARVVALSIDGNEAAAGRTGPRFRRLSGALPPQVFGTRFMRASQVDPKDE